MTARKPPKRGRGRPLHGDAKRSVVLHSKVTPAAAAIYLGIAARRRLTMSDLIASLLRDAAVAERIV